MTTDKETAIEIINKCRCLDPVTELKMIRLALRYWEDGNPADNSVMMAANFILENDESICI